MNFGAFVATREEDVLGTIERVLLDPATNEVQGYVVHTTLGRDRHVVVPIRAVHDMDDGLALNLSSAEAEKLPDYVTTGFGAGTVGPSSGLPDWSQIIELSVQTRIECADGDVGTLGGIVVDEMTAEVTDIIVQLKDRRRSAPVPLAWASSLRGDRIKFQCARAEI